MYDTFIYDENNNLIYTKLCANEDSHHLLSEHLVHFDFSIPFSIFLQGHYFLLLTPSFSIVSTSVGQHHKGWFSPITRTYFKKKNMLEE